MKIATFNVNSIRIRLPIVLQWLEQHQPDVLCLQETKVTDDQFPALALAGIARAARAWKAVLPRMAWLSCVERLNRTTND